MTSEQRVFPNNIPIEMVHLLESIRDSDYPVLKAALRAKGY